MKLYAFILTSFVLRAQSASLKPSDEKIIYNLEKNVKVTPNEAVIPEPKVEEKQLEKNQETPSSIVPEINDNIIIKKVEVDLKNVNPPLHQEHEIQNEELLADKEKALIYVNTKIEQTREVLNEKIKSVSDNFENFIKNNENTSIIEQNINNLKESFQRQFTDLNSAVLAYINTDSVNVKSELKTDNNVNKIILKSKLNDVENNLADEIKLLADSVELFTKIREENKIITAKEVPLSSNSSSTSAPVIENQNNPVQSFFNNLIKSVTTSMENLQQTIRDNVLDPITRYVFDSIVNSGTSSTEVKKYTAKEPAPTSINTNDYTSPQRLGSAHNALNILGTNENKISLSDISSSSPITSAPNTLQELQPAVETSNQTSQSVENTMQIQNSNRPKDTKTSGDVTENKGEDRNNKGEQ